MHTRSAGRAAGGAEPVPHGPRFSAVFNPPRLVARLFILYAIIDPKRSRRSTA